MSGIENVAAGVTITEGMLLHGDNRYTNWCIAEGKPHRSEIGEFVLRLAISNAGQGGAALVSGEFDRPFKEFLDLLKVKCITIPGWNDHRVQFVSWSPSISGPLPALSTQDGPKADIEEFGAPILEADMERMLIAIDSCVQGVLGPGFVIQKSQHSIPQGRPDLIATDPNGRNCIIECKRGALRKSHIGQLIEYHRQHDPDLCDARKILLLLPRQR